MELQKIHEEMKKINESDKLTSEEKKARLKVYEGYIFKCSKEREYQESLISTLKMASDMVIKSNGSYQIQDTIEFNKIALKGHIIDSDDYKELLRRANNKDITRDDIRVAYLENDKSHVKNQDINGALILYEKFEDLEEIEQAKMFRICNCLNDLIGKDIVSNYKEENIINEDGKAIIRMTNKTEDELKANYNKAMARIDELYVNEGILDIQTKNLSMEMINELFNYYEHGNKKIPTMNQQFSNNFDSEKHVM